MKKKIKLIIILTIVFLIIFSILVLLAAIDGITQSKGGSLGDLQSQYMDIEFVTGKFKKQADGSLIVYIYDTSGSRIYTLRGFFHSGSMITLTGDYEDTKISGEFKAGKYEISGTLCGEEFYMKGPRSSANGYIGSGSIALGQAAETSGKLLFPLANNFYMMTSDYTVRRHPIYGYVHQHAGVDLACGENADVIAAASGVVTYAGYNGGYGNMVEITHANGLKTRYGHCNSLYVSKGDKVRAGTLIAAAGSTGNSTGTHLHFEVILKGKLQDPKKYITIPNS